MKCHARRQGIVSRLNRDGIAYYGGFQAAVLVGGGDKRVVERPEDPVATQRIGGCTVTPQPSRILLEQCFRCLERLAWPRLFTCCRGQLQHRQRQVEKCQPGSSWTHGGSHVLIIGSGLSTVDSRQREFLNDLSVTHSVRPGRRLSPIR